MKLVLFPLLLSFWVLLSYNCCCQVSTYSFASVPGTYTPIGGGSVIKYNDIVTSSNISNATLDDDVYYNRSIGFSFSYNGSNYSSFGFNSNGWMILGNSNTFGSSFAPISSATASHSNIIAAAGVDIIGGIQLVGAITSGGNTITVNANSPISDVLPGDPVTGTGIPLGALVTAVSATTVTIDKVLTASNSTANWKVRNGNIRYETIGVAPNRVLVLQYTRFGRFSSLNVGDRMNFQIRLSENSNKIELAYGAWSSTSVSGTNLQVGLKGATNSDFNNRTTNADWSATSSGIFNSSIVTFNSTVNPTNGLTYTFTPPAFPGATAGDYRTINFGNWSTTAIWQRYDGSNWVAAATPPSSTDGVINIRHTVDGNSPITADQIIVDIAGGLNISSNFSLNDGVGDDLVVNGVFTLSGGSFQTSGNSVINNQFLWSGGTFTGAGAFAITGNINWTGGTLSRTLIIDNGKQVNISSSVSVTNGELNNNGTVNWNAGYIFLTNGTITNNAVFNANPSGYDIRSQGGSNTFINNNVLNVTGTYYNSITFNNAGTINLPAASDFANTGTYNHNAGGLLAGSGSFSQAGVCNINSAMVIPAGLVFMQTAGTLENTAGLTINGNLSWSGGTFSGAGAFAITGNINWSGGILRRTLVIDNGKQLNITSSVSITNGELINNGAVNWNLGYIFLTNGTITNNAVFNANPSGYDIRSQGGSNTFINNGEFILLNNQSTAANIPFSNSSSGIIKGIGSLAFNSTFTNTGTISPGTSIGKLTLDGAQLFSPTSTLNIELSDNTGAGIGNDVVNRAGNLTLNGKLIVTQLQPVPAGPYTIIQLTSGTITGNFSSIVLPPNHTLTVTSTAVILNAAPENSYVIVASSGGNGNITPAGNVSVTEHQNQAFTMTPNAGYQVANVMVDAVSVGAASNYTFNNVTGSHTISVSFSLIAFPIINVAPADVNYGNLGLGFSLNDSVIITNTGTAPLMLSSILPSNPIYTFVYAKAVIAPGDTTHLILKYTPTVAGSSSATVAINHNAAGSPTIINLQGNAVATGFTFQVNHIGGLTENLHGATWFDNKTGFVSGANGKLYKTTDGGATWTQLPFAGTANLYSIRSIGSELWLFGSNGHICVSHDGGLTFVPFTMGTTNPFYDGYFVNGYYGFAAGGGGTLARYNGTGWQSYNLGTGNFYGVYAYGRSAWAVGAGGIAYRYNHAADAWISSYPGVPNDLYGVGFWNDNIGYIVGSGGLIYKTINGGATWSPTNSGVNVNIRSIRCFSANVAWACCENGDVLQTTDGGGTWVRMPLNPRLRLQRIDFNGCQGISICGDGAVVTFQTNLCNSGYNTLRYVRRGTGTSYGFGGGWYSTRQNGGLGGRYGTVLITTNGGLNWGSTNPYTLEHINAIRIHGNTSFIAGTGGYLAKCNNLGTNWVRRGGIPGDIDFNSISFCPCDKGWAVGSKGAIWMYDGTDWDPEPVQTQKTFRCVHSMGDVVYAVGDDGMVWKRDGNGWRDISPGLPNHFYGVAFVNPLIGYIVGSGGIICKTIDGGEHWFPITSPTALDHRCVAVGCELEAMVAGVHGEAFQTTDGGNTWVDKSLDRDVDINSVSLLEGEGLLAAEDGEAYAFQFGSGKVIADITAEGPTSFCNTGSVKLTASGGTRYLWSNGASTPSITVTQPGTYSVVVSNAAGCNNEKDIAITRKQGPAITFDPQHEVCINGGKINMVATPAGGTFSGSGIAGNSFDPAAAGAGQKTVTYSVTYAEGCSSTKDAVITVNDVANIAFSIQPTICVNAPTITLSATPTGGTFSGVGTSANTFNPSTAGAGTKTITYSYTTPQGCTSIKTADIKVNPLPEIVFTLQGAVCVNGGLINLVASPLGGSFSGPGVVGNTFNPSTAGAGNKPITYTYTNADGCTASVTKAIVVNPAPTATASSSGNVYYGYTPMQCINLVGSASGGTPGYSYSWNTGSPGAIINVCPTVPTSYTLTVTDAKGCKGTSGVQVNVVDVRCGTEKNPKVKVCHTVPQKHDVQLCVDEHAVPAMLANGDYLGECIVATARLAAPDMLIQPLVVVGVYPNPSNGNFSVQLPVTEGDVRLAVLNSSGVVLDKRTVKGNVGNVQYRLEKLAKGLYMVQVLSGNSLQVLKLVVQ